MSLQYITNGRGEKTAVIMPIGDFEKMREQLEELDDLRLYDQAKARNEPFVTLGEYRSKRRESRKAEVSGQPSETKKNAADNGLHSRPEPDSPQTVGQVAQ